MWFFEVSWAGVSGKDGGQRGRKEEGGKIKMDEFPTGMDEFLWNFG